MIKRISAILLLVTCVLGGVYYVFFREPVSPGPSIAEINQRGGIIHWVLRHSDPISLLHRSKPNHRCLHTRSSAAIFDDQGRLQHIMTLHDIRKVIVRYTDDSSFTLYDNIFLKDYSLSAMRAIDYSDVLQPAFLGRPGPTCVNTKPSSTSRIDYQCGENFYLRYDVASGTLETNLLYGDMRMRLDRSGLIVEDEERLQKRRSKSRGSSSRPSFWDHLFGDDVQVRSAEVTHKSRRYERKSGREGIRETTRYYWQADMDWFSRNLLGDNYSSLPKVTEKFITIAKRDQFGLPVESVSSDKPKWLRRHSCEPLK